MKNTYIKGFTLLESLLVLFICSFFLLIPTLAIKEWQEVLMIEQFFDTVEKNILFTQQMSVVQASDTMVLFSEEEQTLEFITADNENRKVKIPVEVKGRGPKKVSFKKITGNNGVLGKYEFEWLAKKQRIIFQFQMGSGKYVKKVMPL